MKAYRGGGITPPILNFAIRWRQIYSEERTLTAIEYEYS
jgi:hypothetical protein